MAERSPSLSEVCAPLFLYLATFRRNAATSGLSIQQLQAALLHELQELRTECERERRLLPLFERMHYALVSTADQVVLSSAWPQRAGWSMNLLETSEYQTSEGGKKFFRVVEDVLNDPTDAGPELAELLFTCMALGFQGELLGERKELERRRRQLYEKARLSPGSGDPLTPAAYGRNATQNLTKLPTVGILRLVLVALGAVLFAVLAGNAVTRIKNDRVLESIEQLIEDLESESSNG